MVEPFKLHVHHGRKTMEEEAALRAKIQAMKNLLQVRASAGNASGAGYIGDSGFRSYRGSPYPSSASGAAYRPTARTPPYYNSSTRSAWPPRNSNAYRSQTYVRPAVVSANKVWRKDMQSPANSSTPESTRQAQGASEPQTTSALTKRVHSDCSSL